MGCGFNVEVVVRSAIIDPVLSIDESIHHETSAYIDDIYINKDTCLQHA